MVKCPECKKEFSTPEMDFRDGKEYWKPISLHCIPTSYRSLAKIEDKH